MPRLGRALGFSLLAVLAVVGALELGIKLYYFGLEPSPKELLVPSDNPVLVYELARSLDSTYRYLNPHQRRWPYRVRLGEDGFRRVPATTGGAGVVVLGDSYAFGYGVDDHETFANRLAEALPGRAEVHNWGVPGYNLVQQVELLRTRGAEADPSVVVLALHPNDFEPSVFARPAEVAWVRASHLYAVLEHLHYVSQDVESLLEASRQRRVAEGRAAFEKLLALRAERGFELLLFRVSCWSGADDREVAQLLREARRRGIPTVDLDHPFCGELETHSIPDDGHPTAEGHARLAARLLPSLEPLLPRP